MTRTETRSRSDNPQLDDVRIASPCPASWDAMDGDDRVRFCQDCKLNVYNLSAMTREQAEDLLANREGRLCVRLFQRADGTVITQDCPVGLAAVRRQLARARARVAAFVGVLFSFALGCARGSDRNDTPDGTQQPPDVRQIMGDVCDPVPLQGEVYVPENPDAVLMGKIAPPQHIEVTPPPKSR